MENKSDRTISVFDLHIGQLDGLPGVLQTRPTTVRTVVPIVGLSQSFIIQTFRNPEEGDTLFIEHVGPEGTTRLVIPPKASAVVYAQRDALTARSRARGAKRAAALRKERGDVPFQKKAKK